MSRTEVLAAAAPGPRLWRAIRWLGFLGPFTRFFTGFSGGPVTARPLESLRAALSCVEGRLKPDTTYKI
jgi:hypothetical protein